ncbi:MAG: outer membrane protein assembly factor BamA [Bacteroidales bacterium]|nr:outer membrane protein assembly factor BamA [Bacteroidales bacterium]
MFFAIVNTFAQDSIPTITYSMNAKKYKIADIKVTGASNYEDFVLIGFSGLVVGDIISVPGEEITNAIKRFWKQGLFSDVKILATKIEDGQVWLEIQLTQRPRISQIRYHGLKKSEREDLAAKIGLVKGNQVTPNLLDRAKIVIKKFFDEKGYNKTEVTILQQDDLSDPNMVILDINVDKHERTKVRNIYFHGNDSLSSKKLRKVMKKTNEKFNLKKRFVSSWLEMFGQKKFVSNDYKADKENIISKYNELGYRDARIIADSVVRVNDKMVDIYLDIEEGDKYYLKDIRWVGNTQYDTKTLNTLLELKPGDIYNQKKLFQRLNEDEDAVSSIYYNNGYLFFNADPVEVELGKDSVTLEIRITEGKQATINKVIINGNDRLYEDIVRRELRTKPGELFSKDALQRSAREIAQMGHFDPESMGVNPIPDPDNGTVDIEYNLTSKANDQIEFSAGWGQTGVIGKLSLKFTNFSLSNIFKPSTYKGIIPQGEGQTLTLSGQTNGRYYQSYSISFMDPWFGGKRPNTLSVGAYFSYQTDINSNYYGNSYYNPYMYGYGSGYGYGYGYGGSGYDYTAMYDLNKSIQMLGISIGYGKRLSWPDDYFQIMFELNYQRYKMKNWSYFVINNGTCNNVNLGVTLSRNSIDNPLYTRRGSMFSLSLNATPPYSLWDGKDYANMADAGDKYKMVEYYKIKFKAKLFTPLAPLTVKRTPVLMSRIEYGFVGHYNKNKISPFETFYMGGDGMTGYSSYYVTETIGLRGYNNGSLTPNGYYGYAYTRLSLELRYPFILEPSTTIYGLAFVEAGNAWSQLSDFNPFDLKRSAGVGVRIFLPMVGLLGIDWAYGFDPVFGSRQYSGSQIHFILGQEF